MHSSDMPPTLRALSLRIEQMIRDSAQINSTTLDEKLNLVKQGFELVTTELLMLQGENRLPRAATFVQLLNEVVFMIRLNIQEELLYERLKATEIVGARNEAELQFATNCAQANILYEKICL